METNRSRTLCASLIAALLLAATNSADSAANAAWKCQPPDITDVEAKLDSVVVPKGIVPARNRVRYYDLANNGTLIVGDFLTRDAARNPDLSEYQELKMTGLGSMVHIGCGALYTGGKGSCPILEIEYDVRSRRIKSAECMKVLARVFE
ncbi:MAG: hypothetical protein JO261_15710 [Alphaproteobacteria bacterium]|nr:hypothetical protein [Alphaproteobacteria bacterium]MBV9695139.1 hypothetical protein [Alphaproteobacteria bacterium]